MPEMHASVPPGTEVATLAGGCAPSHTMRQGPDDGSCPARYLGSLPASQTDAGERNVPTWNGSAEAAISRRTICGARRLGGPSSGLQGLGSTR